MAKSDPWKSTILMIGALAAVVPGFGPLPAAADGRLDKGRDQDRVRRALEHGEVRPLTEILQMIGLQIDGEIVETDFEKKHGLWVYEIKYITNSGRMREIYVDARSGRIIKRKDD